MLFHSLTSTFTPTISTWSFYCDFAKVEKNTFQIKMQLGILNALLGEPEIEQKFLEVMRNYPECRQVLPILLAVRDPFHLVLDTQTKELVEVKHLFEKKTMLLVDDEILLLKFFRDSGLKNIFENKKISSLSDYVFGVETGLNSNARKNRSGTQMETLVESFVAEFCQKKWYSYKAQATAKWMQEHWNIEVKSDKSARSFDFAILAHGKVHLIETNFYSGGGSKLKAVAGEFSWLYGFLKDQGIKLSWITDGSEGWKTAHKPLEEAYEKMEGNIFNISMLKEGILDEIIL